MAKKKISGLPAGSALNGTELVPIVQTGTTKRITTQDIANLGNSSGVEGSGTINRLPKFTASSTIGNSAFFDDGTNQGTETTTAVNRFIMSANASIAKIFSFRSANLPRWAFRVDGTESGANAGADLAIRRYNDAGTYIDSPMSFDRSDGTASILKDATINGVKVGRGAGSIAGNTALGTSVLNANTSGDENTAVGFSALLSNTTGSFNVAIGKGAQNENTTGNFNTALGLNSLYFNSTGNNNTAIGRSALQSNTASNNTAVGYEAALSNTSGEEITAIGYQALKNSTGNSNTAIGNIASFANTTGVRNTALGVAALTANTTGGQNTAIGYIALLSNVTGENNTAIGSQSLRFNTASNNTAVGFEAGKANTSGDGLTALGLQALLSNTTGEANTAIGTISLSNNTTGFGNTAIGFNTQSGNFSGSVIIGKDAVATAANQFVVGSAGTNAGAIATEVLVSDRSWAVRINGTDYKILLKA